MTVGTATAQPTGAAEHADLAALHIGLEEIDHLDAGLEQLTLGSDVGEVRGGTVDRPALFEVQIRVVERLTERRSPVLELLALHKALHKARHKTDRPHQVWQEGSHPEMIEGQPMMLQKLAPMLSSSSP